ncbi:hypothetical protein [Massilia endophytica]|uniref:hypothetical protein n=1 Tax=Massilia endophytica TaxID=2899220 RepID=UPI001E33BDF2|nr:hypothetical protein [Massilia endophytica]UGQ45339.1 hypothetical protein LSQ66_16285 [Massilia endophytica]
MHFRTLGASLLAAGILAAPSAHAGLFGNFISCSDDGAATRQLDRKGFSFSGNYQCWKGSGAFRGKGTLFAAEDNSTVRATNWFGEYDSGAIPRIGGEQEHTNPRGNLLERYHEHEPWLFEVLTADGKFRVSGPTKFRYMKLLDSGLDGWELKINDKVIYSMEGPGEIRVKKIACPGTPAGLFMVKGACVNGMPDGDVELLSGNGLQQYLVKFADGRPTGNMEYRTLHLDSRTLNDGEQPFLPNIVRPESDRERDIVKVKRFISANGRPELVAGKLEFAAIAKYTINNTTGTEYFYGGRTVDGIARGDGTCQVTGYNDMTHVKSDSRSYDREACTVADGRTWLYRVDQVYQDRMEARAAERREAEAESDRRYEEEKRRREAEWAAADAEMRNSRKDDIGLYILQKGAEMNAHMQEVNRQTQAALRDAERIRQRQAAERERESRDRAERQAEDRRQDAAIRARLAQGSQPSQPSRPAAQETPPPARPAPQQQAPRPVMASPAPVLTYAAQQQQMQLAATAPSAPAAERPRPERKIELGPVVQEMLAVCRQGKSGGWACHGGLDNQVLFDEPSVESALARQGCEGGTWAAGGPTLDGVKWEAYRCNKSLGAGDYDVAARYHMVTARRSYQCEKGKPSDGRCTTPYGMAPQ